MTKYKGLNINVGMNDNNVHNNLIANTIWAIKSSH